MVHMTFDGMISEDILSFLRADDILILRHPDKSLAVTAVEKAIDYSTKVIEYDHGFDFTDRKRFSCTEFTDVVYGGLEYNPDLENESTFNKLARRFYKSVILPDDLLFSSLSVAWRK